MQCFILPVSLCRELETILCKFWWLNLKTKKGIHWCKWSTLCVPKAPVGKIGMKTNLRIRFFTCTSIESKILSPRGFYECELGSYPCFTWWIILGARNILEQGTRWKIGNGQMVNIWNDAWLSSPREGRVKIQHIDIIYTSVANLINKERIT
ncbi:reverse transcriptase [Gossypium australe]|uniref:Reverse transcriptase n=1 Tax=Gossypium australe TaxID=47621 RepID=A0A5B6X4D2_9ROSI|nr:reverse transcriptase [Gossypium australe]